MWPLQGNGTFLPPRGGKNWPLQGWPSLNLILSLSLTSWVPGSGAGDRASHDLAPRSLEGSTCQRLRSPQQTWSGGFAHHHCCTASPGLTSPSWTPLVPREGIKAEPGELSSRAIRAEKHRTVAGRS